MSEASGEGSTGRPAIRGAIGIVTACVPIVAGILSRSPWTIPLFAVLFAIAYIVGRLDVWRPLLAAGLSVRLVTMLLSTLLVQVLVVAILYLIGLAIGWLFGDVDGFRTLGLIDTGLAVVLIAMMALTTFTGGASSAGREG